MKRGSSSLLGKTPPFIIKNIQTQKLHLSAIVIFIFSYSSHDLHCFDILLHFFAMAERKGRKKGHQPGIHYQKGLWGEQAHQANH
jgi:hypothetical protein